MPQQNRPSNRTETRAGASVPGGQRPTTRMTGASQSAPSAKGAAASTATVPAAEQSVGKKVISDISGAQITASALAAVTSLFFSSNIGLAGSVIGVAASAAVTALSSSIYKSFIEGTKAKAKAKAAENEAIASVQDETGGAPQTTQQFKREAFTHTEAAVDRNSGKYTHAAAKHSSKGVSGRFDIVNKKWFAIVLLTVIGLLTVFVTAHIITTATGGEGIGTKTTPIFQTSETEKVNDDMSSDDMASSSDTDESSSSDEPSISESSSSQMNDNTSSSASAAGAYETSSSSSADQTSSSTRTTVSSSSANVDTTSSSSSQAASSSSAAASSSSSED